MLEDLRGRFGAPIVILSAYRCAKHNAAVGGAPSSQHLLGRAADIRVGTMTPAQMEAVARLSPLVHGLGRSDPGGFIHVDTRDVAKVVQVRWCYDSDDHQIPWYAPMGKPQSV